MLVQTLLYWRRKTSFSKARVFNYFQVSCCTHVGITNETKQR